MREINSRNVRIYLLLAMAVCVTSYGAIWIWSGTDDLAQAIVLGGIALVAFAMWVLNIRDKRRALAKSV